jgi:hypothetical protein
MLAFAIRAGREADCPCQKFPAMVEHIKAGVRRSVLSDALQTSVARSSPGYVNAGQAFHARLRSFVDEPSFDL